MENYISELQSLNIMNSTNVDRLGIYDRVISLRI